MLWGLRKREWIWEDKNIALCLRDAQAHGKFYIHSDASSHSYVSTSAVQDAGAEMRGRMSHLRGSQSISIKGREGMNSENTSKRDVNHQICSTPILLATAVATLHW